jgi:hypothetical protein
MDRYITDVSLLTAEDLKNYNWDIIELNIDINHLEVRDWFNIVSEKFGNMQFNVSKTELMKPEIRDRMKEFQEQHLWGTPKQWTLQWSVQRDDAIPFRYIADPAQYPEILEDDFDKKFNTPLEQYYFGGFKKLVELLGDGAWEVARLVQLDKDTGLKKHVDIQPPQFLPRMHYQIEYTQNAAWWFGENMERKYVLENGKLYIMNTAVLHTAKNEDDLPWVMLHSNPTDDAINKLFKMSRNA